MDETDTISRFTYAKMRREFSSGNSMKRAQIGEIRLASGQIVRQLHRLHNFAKLCVCRLLLMRISPMQFIPMQLQNPAAQFLHCHPRDIRDFLADCAAPAR